MASNQEFCTQHGACEEKIRNMENKVNSLETKITDEVSDCKNDFNKALSDFKKDTERELEGVKNNTSHLENAVNSLNVTVARLEVVINGLADFIKEFKEDKRSTKTAFIYPFAISILMLIIGGLAGKFIK